MPYSEKSNNILKNNYLTSPYSALPFQVSEDTSRAYAVSNTCYSAWRIFNGLAGNTNTHCFISNANSNGITYTVLVFLGHRYTIGSISVFGHVNAYTIPNFVISLSTDGASWTGVVSDVGSNFSAGTQIDYELEEEFQNCLYARIVMTLQGTSNNYLTEVQLCGVKSSDYTTEELISVPDASLTDTQKLTKILSCLKGDIPFLSFQDSNNSTRYISDYLANLVAMINFD